MFLKQCLIQSSNTPFEVEDTTVSILKSRKQMYRFSDKKTSIQVVAKQLNQAWFSDFKISVKCDLS